MYSRTPVAGLVTAPERTRRCRAAPAVRVRRMSTGGRRRAHRRPGVVAGAFVAASLVAALLLAGLRPAADRLRASGDRASAGGRPGRRSSPRRPRRPVPAFVGRDARRTARCGLRDLAGRGVVVAQRVGVLVRPVAGRNRRALAAVAAAHRGQPRAASSASTSRTRASAARQLRGASRNDVSAAADPTADLLGQLTVLPQHRDSEHPACSTGTGAWPPG